LEERISGRLTCPCCQEIYNALSHGPKVSGRCDRCDGLLEVRADDSKAVLQGRIADFRFQTEPLVAYYRARGTLVDIAGDGDIEAVGTDILASVNGRGLRTSASSV
jgi:adenylate kinase